MIIPTDFQHNEVTAEISMSWFSFSALLGYYTIDSIRKGVNHSHITSLGAVLVHVRIPEVPKHHLIARTGPASHPITTVVRIILQLKIGITITIFLATVVHRCLCRGQDGSLGGSRNGSLSWRCWEPGLVFDSVISRNITQADWPLLL
jgi:hypothetical protein